MERVERGDYARPYIIKIEGGKSYKVWKWHSLYRAWSAKQRVVNLLEDIAEQARFRNKDSAADFIADAARKNKEERASKDEIFGVRTPLTLSGKA